MISHSVGGHRSSHQRAGTGRRMCGHLLKCGLVTVSLIGTTPGSVCHPAGAASHFCIARSLGISDGFSVKAPCVKRVRSAGRRRFGMADGNAAALAPSSSYTIYLLQNGSYVDVTGSHSLQEGHVYDLSGVLIGTVPNPDTGIIVDSSGNDSGYVTTTAS